MAWTTLEHEDLKKLASEGHSASAISRRLSDLHKRNISRNAVISRCSREGVRLGRSQHNAQSGQRAALSQRLSSRENGQVAKRLYALRDQMASQLPVMLLPTPSADPVEPLHITLFDLTPYRCAFPYGDESFTFCGHEVREGSSYCDEHHARCLDGKARKPVHVPERLLGKRAA